MRREKGREQPKILIQHESIHAFGMACNPIFFFSPFRVLDSIIHFPHLIQHTISQVAAFFGQAKAFSLLGVFGGGIGLGEIPYEASKQAD
jgi:hypothetical protein